MPIRIDCSGYVFEEKEATDSFLVTVWQEIWGIPPLTPFTAHAIMSMKHYNNQPYQHLPEQKTIIHFGGDILIIKNGVAFVVVHHHSYFSSVKDEVFELQFT